MYTIEDFIADVMRAGHGFAETVQMSLGYDVLVDYDICHTLQRNRPHVWDTYVGTVTDYQARHIMLMRPKLSRCIRPVDGWVNRTNRRTARI
jgi:hypothetical protein